MKNPQQKEEEKKKKSQPAPAIPARAAKYEEKEAPAAAAVPAAQFAENPAPPPPRSTEEKKYIEAGNNYTKDAEVVLNRKILGLNNAKKLAGFCQRLCGAGEEERKAKAVELYKKAANSYKLGKDYENSVKAYKKCAEYEESTGIACQNYVDAAMAMKKVNTSEAVKLMELAVKGYTESCDFRYVSFCIGRRLGSTQKT